VDAEFLEHTEKYFLKCHWFMFGMTNLSGFFSSEKDLFFLLG